MNFFDRIPRSVMWVAIAVSLFMNVINATMTRNVAEDSHANAALLCKGSVATTGTVNTANTSIYDLIDTGLNAAIKRIGTPKELPSDKNIVTIYTGFLKGITTTTPLNCKALR